MQINTGLQKIDSVTLVCNCIKKILSVVTKGNAFRHVRHVTRPHNTKSRKCNDTETIQSPVKTLAWDVSKCNFK